MSETFEDFVQEMKDWADQHGFYMYENMGKIRKMYDRGKQCLCDPSRTCPCPQSVDEVNSTWKTCKCSIMMTRAYWRKTMEDNQC